MGGTVRLKDCQFIRLLLQHDIFELLTLAVFSVESKRTTFDCIFGKKQNGWNIPLAVTMLEVGRRRICLFFDLINYINEVF